jgi:hypothetical protein
MLNDQGVISMTHRAGRRRRVFVTLTTGGPTRWTDRLVAGRLGLGPRSERVVRVRAVNLADPSRAA